MKLTRKKIRWIIRQKEKKESSGIIAKIQHITRRRVDQLWKQYRETGVIPIIGEAMGRSKKPVTTEESKVIDEAYRRFRYGARMLAKLIRKVYVLIISYNRIHRYLMDRGLARAEASKRKQRKWARGEQWMNLSELAQYIGEEEKVEQALLELGILKRYPTCPFCGEDRIGRVRRFKFKCYRCNKEWEVRRGSILEGLKIPFTKFLMAIKLFELDTSVRESAKQLGLAYNTVYHLYQILHHAIVITESDNRSFSGEIEMDESYFGGRRKGNRGRGGKVKIEVVHDVKGDTLLELAIRKVRRGSLINTDRFRSYNGLVSYGFKHKRIDHGKRFANGKGTSMVSKVSGHLQKNG